MKKKYTPPTISLIWVQMEDGFAASSIDIEQTPPTVTPEIEITDSEEWIID